MKNLFYLLSVLVFFLLVNCKENVPITPAENNQESGKLFLKIDTKNAPASVVWVNAHLSREGYEPISNSLNLLSDSTADITLQDIQAGNWHLRVDATDSDSVVLYSGETDVEVFAGFTTQVNLILEPTGEGTGNIYIWVTWGRQGNDWSDYDGNPVLSSSGTYYETHGVGQTNIIYIDGKYKMWYLGDAGGNHKFVMYAESDDGINWNRPVSEPVLSPGEEGTWDDLAVHPGTIMYEDGKYYMYYSGWSDPGGRWDIGFAESQDGITWKKNTDPILTGTEGWEYQIGPSSIIKVNGIYYLYYYGRTPTKVGLMTSTDRIHWSRNQSNPILVADKSWENTGVYYPTVYKQDDQFIMIYMNNSATGFGKATSTDGVNWTKDNKNPFFTVGDTHNNWANNKIAYPNIVRVNDKYRIYYSGYSNYDSQFKIGFVTE